jgi:hypothetical protein
MHLFSYIDTCMSADRIIVVTQTAALLTTLLSMILLSDLSTAVGVRIRVMVLLSRAGSLCASKRLSGWLLKDG